MSNYQAVVSRVEKLDPITGADRIELATVAGEQVIVRKGSWQVGDIGIYFPINILLSHEYMMKNELYRKNPETGEAMGGYMEPDRRVRYIRMKGVGSRGMFMPVSSFNYLKPNKATFNVGEEFDKIGDNIICEKYVTAVAAIPDKNQKIGKSRSKKILNFYEIGDTGHLTRNIHRLERLDVLVITEKLHGTSARTGYLSEIETKPNLVDRLLSKFGYEKKKVYRTVSGTRRTVIDENDRNEKGKYSRYYFHSLFRPMLSPGMIIYYEIVGPGVMEAHNAHDLKEISSIYGDKIEYTYGVPQDYHEAYVYKIVDHSESGKPIVYSWDQLVEWCESHEVKYVPVIGKVIYDGNKIELINAIAGHIERSSWLSGAHPMEGVVVQTKLGPFKYKSDTFCQLEGIMLNSTQYVDPEDLA